MLTRIRDSSKSLAFYVLGGIVVAVLIISFGTPSLSSLQVQSGASTAAKVGRTEISADDFRQTFQLAGGGQYPPELAKAQRLKEQIMDRIIERELLAEEAERMGFLVGDDEVSEFIARSRMMLFGRESVNGSVQKDGVFDYDRFRRFVQFYGMSAHAFMDMQKRELLAARVRSVLAAGVSASLDEVKDRFVRDGDQVNLEYLRFPVRRLEDTIEPTPEEVAAYLLKNEKKVKDDYEQKKFLFEKVPEERKLRHIVVKFASAPSDLADKPDDKATPEAKAKAEAEAAAAAKAANRNKSAARALADKLAAEIRGGKDIRVVAARLGTSAAKGAEKDAPKAEATRLGWRRKGATTLPPTVEDKIWAAKDGVLVGPEEDGDGFHLVLAEGKREGDIAFDAVKGELAEDLARKEIAQTRAKAQADELLAAAKKATAAGKTWKDLYPAPVEKPAAPGPGAPPQAEETGLFSRRGSVVEGIGVSAELARAAFALGTDDPFAGPFEVAGSYVIVRLKEHRHADMAEFDKNKSDLVLGASELKGRQVAQEWALRRCKEANDGKKLSVNRAALVYEDGKPSAVPYEPCAPPSRLGL